MSRWEGKYVIGLTGNIAVGKSVVRQMLQHLGAYTIDADGLTHQAMAPGAPAYQPIIEMFGKWVVQDDGSINRALLGSIVFGHAEGLAKLEAIVHPVVNQAIQTLVTRAKQPVIVIEAIKLLESSLNGMVDSIWVVDASPEAQLQRLMDKRRMSLDEARKRIVAQGAQSDKLPRANVIIMNDGNVEDTWKQVQASWNDVRRKLMGANLPSPATPTVNSGVSSMSAPTMASRPNATQPMPPRTSTGEAPAIRKLGTGQLSPLPSVQPLRPQPAAPAPAADDHGVHVKRGMPGNAEAIAKFRTRVTGRPTDRMEVMLAFGQKSFLLAVDQDDNLVGLSGWQVENLITRVDEFYVDMSVPREAVIRVLVNAIEDASRELQSEVSFIFLPATTPVEVIQSFLTTGYNFLKIEEVKFPAWREAAHEMLSGEGQALIKQLRTDRVLKPI